MNDHRSHTSDPEVSLVFPPLVNTSFGTYFASTAVLAGYLSAHGVGVMQADLNEELAVFLLREEYLDAAARGELEGGGHIPAEAFPAVAARLLRRHRHLMFDDQGRHLFRNDIAGPAHLLHALARPYLVDIPLNSLLDWREESGVEKELYDAFYEWSGYVEQLPATIQVVGISVPMAAQLAPALLLARRIRALRPDISTILGGPTLSLMDPFDLDRLLAVCDEIDAVVRFDGEEPLLELVKRKRSGAWSVAGIGGVSGREGGKVLHNPPTPGPRLDDLPYAEYDPVILSRLADPEVDIIQARGCYWGECTYCDFVELYDGSPAYRTRTPKRFVDEMEYLFERHGIRRFGVITEAIPPAFSMHLSEEILRRGLDVAWSSFAMVERRFTPELFELMVRGGCDYLVVGVETMNDRVLKLVKKAASEEENISFLLNARKAGIGVHINLIPDLPSTTCDEAMRALDIFRSLSDCVQWVTVFPFEATRSSAVGRDPNYFGLEVISVGSSSGQAQNALNHLEVIDPAMSRKQREEVHAAYFNFADEMNARQLERHHAESRSTGGPLAGFARLVDPDSADEALLCFADDYVDIHECADSVQCYHWATRQFFHMPKGWGSVIAMVREMGEFRKWEFCRRFDPVTVGEDLFARMVEYKLLVVGDISGEQARVTSSRLEHEAMSSRSL